MSDGLSQSDLDALFAGFPGTAEETKTEKKGDEENGLSQSALDALLSGVEWASEEPARSSIELKMEDAWQAAPPVAPDAGDILSQDEIDKMLESYRSGG